MLPASHLSMEATTSQKWEPFFRDMINDRSFPCMAAKAALANQLITIKTVGALGDQADDEAILKEIYSFIARRKEQPDRLSSFVVIFDDAKSFSEEEFESLLWKKLESLHALDQRRYTWSPKVSADINSPDFSFSLGGEAFFVIGFHANSSRRARRFEKPALVFNLHEQFERLRSKGIFETLRDKIRKRDLAFSGSVNPMADDHGSTSEALQYSGRQVNKTSKCPFSAFFNRLGARTL